MYVQALQIYRIASHSVGTLFTHLQTCVNVIIILQISYQRLQANVGQLRMARPHAATSTATTSATRVRTAWNVGSCTAGGVVPFISYALCVDSGCQMLFPHIQTPAQSSCYTQQFYPYDCWICTQWLSVVLSIFSPFAVLPKGSINNSECWMLYARVLSISNTL